MLSPAATAHGRVVAVAMSGGVDSSVAAALLREQGADVVGIMLRLWSEPGADSANKCCTLGAVDDARAVADLLDIPFTVLDASATFKSVVVDDFTSRTRAGETPNPCFKCNRSMRFGYLLDRARALGADALATGHYARTGQDESGRVTLLRGRDTRKDQSYMLHRLGQEELVRAVFPVGDLTKAEVRSQAARLGLPVASRPDSVDLCWVGAEGVGGFLGRTLPSEALKGGPIVDGADHVLGEHAGLVRYTIGQRRGLGITGPEPLYVTERDFASNRLVVGHAADLDSRLVEAKDWTWVAGVAPSGPIEVTAKVRYGAPDEPALLQADGEFVTVTFARPVRAAAPGQGLVAYRGDTVLGGGTIVRSRGREADDILASGPTQEA
jgi:tRNA-specific 2-thiouridylase